MRMLGAMALFLFAVSFLHFGEVHGPDAWAHELLLHHAGIPLALVVLLQDYRFLLLDVFIRFLGNRQHVPAGEAARRRSIQIKPQPKVAASPPVHCCYNKDRFHQPAFLSGGRDDGAGIFPQRVLASK